MSGTSTDRGRYCELHAHSCYSLLDGLPFPEDLAQAAARCGLPALALTDHDAIYGAVPFFASARAVGLKPILGVELTVEAGGAPFAAPRPAPPRSGNDGQPAEVPPPFHLTLLAENQAGYANLCRLITLARANRPKGQAALPWQALPSQTEGLICLTGCRRGPVARHLLARAPGPANQALDQLLEIFGPASVFVELQRNLCRDDWRLTRALAALACSRRLPCVATGNVHYLLPGDAPLQDVLVSIRERVPLPQPQAARHLRPNHQFYLRRPAAVAALYPDLPEALSNTLLVAERCNVSLPSGLQVLPAYPTPAGLSAQAYLRRLCLEALPRLYPNAQTTTRHSPMANDHLPGHALTPAGLLEKELAMIEHLGLANYFLIVWDIVNFCRRRGILCHGRGSAANSLVARLLGISAVDPIAQGLVVERFLSVEHGGTPDIDLDIDAARRETVIQYVYDRWGRDHAAMACTYVTFRSASALRDLAFALDLPPDSLQPDSPATNNQLPIAADPLPVTPSTSSLHALPRHLGLHNGGMIITGPPIHHLLPVEPASMENRSVVQFDKDYLEQLGIVKIDLLGLRMLSAIADALSLVHSVHGKRLDLERLDFRDPAVYDKICSAHTIGIFQVESGAQVSVIPHLQPRCFQDLVIEISLIRPGPLQGNMVRPYLRRRQGLEPIAYPHPALKSALQETLGVIVFQEQVIKIARDFAGFPAGRGEVLRRALGRKHAAEALEKFKAEFIEGGLRTHPASVTLPIAEQVWQMIANFAGYSFSKAHAAAFAVIVYWSAWLRVHYPVEYFCGLLRNAPLGTYPANVLESEARRTGVKFLPFDINRSLAQATVELADPAASGHRTASPRRPTAASPSPQLPVAYGQLATIPPASIRFGLDYVHGIGPERAETIVQLRGQRPFTSLADFAQRLCAPHPSTPSVPSVISSPTPLLDRRAVEALILAGAFDQFGERRQLLWDLAEAFDIARRPAAQLPLEVPGERAIMQPMPPDLKLMRTFAVTGVTAGMHLVEIRRDAFARAGCLSYRELQKARNGARVRAGGLVADGLRRPPTANGTSFIRLEDSDGLVDVIIPPAVYAECRQALRSVFIVVEGTLRRQGNVLSLLARHVSPLPPS
jgi:error-prone DNA polymerase